MYKTHLSSQSIPKGIREQGILIININNNNNYYY